MKNMKEETMKQSIRRKRPLVTWGILLAVGWVLSLGCATTAPKKPSALTSTDRGTAVYLNKYEFKKPSEGWLLMENLEGGDFELGFLKFEKGDFPSQTTYMYDEQPYGGSRDLEKRAKYYCTRFLFNSGIDSRVIRQERLTINGHEAIALWMEGENSNRNEKAKSKIYLVKKGNRIISFVCTQWRPLNGTYSQGPFDDFEAFVLSFKFLQKDFYEEFEEKIKELKG
ncbi:MAG: hypothetical protein ACE144_18740 [Thermodesulfobacteriota bacterium]